MSEEIGASKYDWSSIMAPGGWGDEQTSERHKMPASPHLASSGYSSNRARFPTRAARQAHYVRKGELEAQKEIARRAHWLKFWSQLGEPNWVSREAARKTRKAAERAPRKAAAKELAEIFAQVPPMYASNRLSVRSSSSASSRKSMKASPKVKSSSKKGTRKDRK